MSSEIAQTEGAPESVIRLRNISKEFPGVLAVDEVDLDILPGEVHVVAGENGAGKSTLMKLLSQVERPSGGGIEISGEEVAFHGPRYAQSLGVAMVYQDFALAPDQVGSRPQGRGAAARRDRQGARHRGEDHDPG